MAKRKQNVINENGKVKNKNRILHRKAKWRSENQNVKNEKVKNKNRNLNRKAKRRSENQKFKTKMEKWKIKTKSLCGPPWLPYYLLLGTL